MPIPEHDISVVIPTYRYREKVGRALRSALASNVGEVIVIDDHSRDGTMQLLAQVDDPRLVAIENPRNLGLWENHLAGISRATRPWIKFLQADDYLLDGALARFAEAADDQVSMVWSCPFMEEEETRAHTLHNRLSRPWRLQAPEALLGLCLKVGWLLGRPSDMLLRTDCIERDRNLWKTEISADLVIGSIAATHGTIVLLPEGNVVNENHARQDARTQGRGLGLTRMVRSAAYLRARPEPALKRFAAEWAAVNFPMAVRVAVSGTLRRQLAPKRAVRLLSEYALIAQPAWYEVASRTTVKEARRFRRELRGAPDIDALLMQIAQLDRAMARVTDVTGVR